MLSSVLSLRHIDKYGMGMDQGVVYWCEDGRLGEGKDVG